MAPGPLSGKTSSVTLNPPRGLGEERMTSCPVFPWGLRWAEALYQPWVPHSWPRDGGRASGWLCTPSAHPASPASMENRDTVWKVRPGNGVTPLGVGLTSAA